MASVPSWNDKEVIKKHRKTAEKYVKDVLSGKVGTCKWTKLACKRFQNDWGNRKELGLSLDWGVVSKVVEFFKVLKHCKGEWAGSPVVLEPWQIFIVANVFGWQKDGLRRFRVVYLTVGRKNGKTTFLAGIGLYLTRFDGEAGAEVYSAATTRDQAKICFDIAKRMVSESDLKNHLVSYKNNLHCPISDSKFEPLASEYDSLDGLNIYAALIDELHAHKTRDLYDVLDTGTGSRRQPLLFSITTAGFNKESVCWELQQYTKKVLEGIIEDDTHFGMIYTLDDGDDWEDESVWLKANPNLRLSVKIDDMRRQAKHAKEMPSQLNAFLTKRLNVWTESSVRWISSDKWNACNGKVDEKKLAGRPCYAGLDLSSTLDITALVHVFPPVDEGPYQVLCRFWIPEDNIRERVRRDRVPYDVWVRQGYIQKTPGDIVDYNFILHQLGEDMEAFDLRDLAFDRWGSTQMIQSLQEMGFEDTKAKHAPRHLIQFGQGFASMAGPTKELEKMVISKEIAHGGNPVLAWMMSNVEIKLDPAGNMKPDKGKSREKIDGVVATIMGLDRATRNSDEGEPRIWAM